ILKRGAALTRRPVGTELTLVERDEVCPSAKRCVEPLERNDGVAVETELEDLLVCGHGAIAVLQGLVTDARLLVEDLELRGAVRDLGATLQDLEEELVLRRLLVELLERHERAGLVAAELQCLPVVLLGEGGVRELGPCDLRDAKRERDLL